jgi:hypothetical protein
MYNCLDDCVKMLARKGTEIYVRKYLETVISSAYFKVPEFREKFL